MQQNGHGRSFTIPARKYEGHPEHSRRTLFAKDREIRRQCARADQVLSTLEFIAATADGKTGGADPQWQVAAILEALTPEIRRAIGGRHE
jgi:hypothetical protein